MSRYNMLSLLVSVLSVGGFVSAAAAAPTVKKLGMGNSNYVQPSGTTTQKVSNPSASNLTQTSGSLRTPSIRVGGSSVKPVNINKVKSNSLVKSESDATDSARLSLGKYIHGVGVNEGYIKPGTSAADIEAQGQEILGLKDRVVQLESEIESKQDVLTPGDGVVIDEGTISVTEEMFGLPDRMTAVEAELDNKVDLDNLVTNYYTKSDIEGVVAGAVQQKVNENLINGKVYDSVTKEYKTVSFVNDFNSGILEEE